MKHLKKLLCIGITAVLLLCLAGCESEDAGHPSPTEEFYVGDFADVISEENEQEILSRAVALQEQTTAQVVTVTVQSLGGEEPVDYATELGREWGVGEEEADNGVVILLSKSDREIFIAVGYGLEGALPDSKTGRIIDLYGMEYLQDDNFSDGLLSIAKAVMGEIYIEYGLEAPDGYSSVNSVSSSDASGVSVAVSWLIMLAILFLFSLLSKRRGGMFLFFGGPRMFTGGGSGFSGGGFSGGGFSGGGGSFGGGGAGRGF